MSRQKTYLSTDEQCIRTLKLTIEWCDKFKPFVQMKPIVLAADWHEQNELIKEVIRETPNLKYKKSFIEFVPLVSYDQKWEFGEWVFGRAKRNTRYFIEGDLCFVKFTNGLDRQPVWCATTKGKNMTGYYCDTDRLGESANIELLGVPGELVGKQLAHPDAQAIMLKLRASKSPRPGMRE